MPFIVFMGKDEHKKALDLIAAVIAGNDERPLEHRITGIISSFEGENQTSHGKVYFFPIPYLSLFNDHDVEYSLLEKKDVVSFLSDEGKQQLIYAWNHRREHISDPEPKKSEN